MAHSLPVTKAVIPAAGMGTRFVPATKAMPKEMLPVIDTPTIQYVVEEAAAAGLTDVLMVTARSKTNIEDHFDQNIELEELLAAKGDDVGLASIKASNDIATMHYVRQGQALGLGHAVLCAADHVGREPFAVLLGDDFIDPRDRLLGVFDAQGELFAEPGYRGCAFAGASAESPSDLVARAADAYRGWVRGLLTDLARDAGAPDPERLGRQLHLLYDGASQSARMDHDPSAATAARAAAETLLDKALSPA